ncbi:MAG TPA: ATP-binding protein [Polyangiaceae bacterium]
MPPSDEVPLPESLRSLPQDDYRLLVESVVDYAIFMLDAGGRVASWNLGAAKIKGYQASEIIGRHFSTFYPPEDVEARKPEKELEIASEAGRVEDEGWRVRKDGSRFWASVVITALRDERGNLRGFGKVTRDLTERRRAEETERALLKEQTARAVAEQAEVGLRLSEERYRSLSQRLEIVLEGVADGITVQDRSGRVVFANSAAARLCGFETPDELMSTPPAQVVERFDVLDENDRPFPPEDLPGRRVLAGAPFGSAVLHVRDRRTGQDRWSSIRATPVLASDGTPDLAINIWHDVSAARLEERRQRYLADATTALGASLDKDEMLATLGWLLVPTLGDWCAIYLLEGERLRGVTSTHADPEKLELTEEYRRSFDPNPNAEHGVWEAVRSGAAYVHNQITDEMLAHGSQSASHLELLRRLGMHAVLAAPIRVRNRVLGAFCLVKSAPGRSYGSTQLELAEEMGRRAGVALENAKLYQDAQDAARAADEAARTAEEASRAKDEFLATVSHELRTPLSAILGWSKLLRDRVTDPAMKKPIEVIHRNAQAQVKIIDDILDVSRVITGKFKLEASATDLVALVVDAIDVVRPSAMAKRIQIEFLPYRNFCLLVADAERLRQVVWNLLSNAVKFTEAEGKIQVSVKQDNSTVVLAVKDSGIGIDPAFLPYVFDRFRQADSSTTRRVSGLGLGLALVRHIVELHGGRVAVTSSGLNQGSTFTIILPIRAVARPASVPPASPALAPAKTPEQSSLHGLRILIVDDEPDARELVAEVLLERGAEVERAGSVADALAVLASFRPQLLVSDIGMPGEDGFSLIRRIRALPAQECGQMPALALTAFAREEDVSRALSAGYSAHVGKPVDPDALVAAIAKLLPLVRSA